MISFPPVHRAGQESSKARPFHPTFSHIISCNQWNFASQRAGLSVRNLHPVTDGQPQSKILLLRENDLCSANTDPLNTNEWTDPALPSQGERRDERSEAQKVSNWTFPTQLLLAPTHRPGARRLKPWRGARLPFPASLVETHWWNVRVARESNGIACAPPHHESSNSSFLRLHMKRLDERSGAERQKRQTGWYATVLPSPFSNGSTSSFVFLTGKALAGTLVSSRKGQNQPVRHVCPRIWCKYHKSNYTRGLGC